ncbi:hypothetical protein EES44_06880 [Streptomyces sp. ADI96-15]|uniref:hypothetical protein n=1 Tax=Streptomyces TaxID=1883 RepID=UPI0003C2D263|nr:hypothetical protein [Streptomyces sp. PVA_94-07]ESQ03076.1 hypothetical protein B590_21337 [Streptomyces sp. PVA_94-07]RPK69628.1 hypothetical protein EES44_06880 [Streptomyces sp. ADI96-15]
MNVHVLVCRDAVEYRDRARAWQEGLPFPVLPGRPLDRYRSLFPEGRLPAVSTAPRAGTVISVGDDAGAAGRLLAAATGREHLAVDSAALAHALHARAGELVAVVGLAEDITASGDWPGVHGAVVGVLTARDPAALSCLVYRSLTADAAAEERVFVATHPMLEDAELADTNEFEDVIALGRRRPKLLVLKALGKECCAALPDGILCGRSDPIDAPVPATDPAHRHMPCMHGADCHRADLAEEQRLPAAELHATVVFTHSCSSIAVGTNAYPHHLALGLGLLEGTAVAVVGALGVHIVQRGAQGDLEDALAENLPLGRAVERLNERAHPINGWLSRFGLLGDPGLVLDLPAGRNSDAASAAATVRRGERDEATVRTLAHVNNVILPRLERLCWLEPGVDAHAVEAFRVRVRETAEDLQAPDLASRVEALETDLAAFQHATAAAITHEIYVNGWNYGGPSLDGMREVSKRPATCPNCARNRAAVITMTHVVHDQLTVRTLQCRRCGDLWWTSEESDEPVVALEGALDTDAVAGRVVILSRMLRNNSPQVLRGGIGFAFAMRRFLGLPPETSAPISVYPGGKAEFRAEIDLVGHQPRPDVHTGVFIAIVNGVYIASSSMMRLTPAPPADKQ